MRAVVLPEHGDIDVLQIRDDRARPAAGPGRVVLRVGASSLNYHDIFTVRGMPGITIPMPVVPGIDVAGRIVEVGEGVAAEWAVGDRVVVMPWLASLPELGLIGEVYDGGLQQYVEVDARLLIRLPDDVSEHLAAALPVAYGTAHRMVIGKGAIRAGTACWCSAHPAGWASLACSSRSASARTWSPPSEARRRAGRSWSSGPTKC
ncbi:quinone oxidoreductase family protein [Leucobacter muris]|uniref:quinone oxidoreductase family protein n=1 Tax=Leucobacter muris TaxID=1935379 RepID=UPI001E2D4989|nr:alcohol dehydrogenase catalytic domain-containing protein [Leucobacter muris]